jgi:hypothetical protein
MAVANVGRDRWRRAIASRREAQLTAKTVDTAVVLRATPPVGSQGYRGVIERGRRGSARTSRARIADRT